MPNLARFTYNTRALQNAHPHTVEVNYNRTSRSFIDVKFDIALDAAFFGYIGAAGQPWTTTRRLIIHETLYDKFLEQTDQKL